MDAIEERTAEAHHLLGGVDDGRAHDAAVPLIRCVPPLTRTERERRRPERASERARDYLDTLDTNSRRTHTRNKISRLNNEFHVLTTQPIPFSLGTPRIPVLTTQRIPYHKLV